MNRIIKAAIKTIAEELAKQELETARDIHKQDCLARFGETPTLKDWLKECMADHQQAEDFIVGADLDDIQQEIGEQLVKQFRKLTKVAVAMRW